MAPDGRSWELAAGAEAAVQPFAAAVEALASPPAEPDVVAVEAPASSPAEPDAAVVVAVVQPGVGARLVRRQAERVLETQQRVSAAAVVAVEPRLAVVPLPE